MTPLFISIIILIIILLYFMYTSYYKHFFKDNLCITCIGNSTNSYTGLTANVTGCNCNNYEVFCSGFPLCTNYTHLFNDIVFGNGDFDADKTISPYKITIPLMWSGSGTIIVIKTPDDTYPVQGIPISGMHNSHYMCGLEYRDTYISQNFKTVVGDSYTVTCFVNVRYTDEIVSTHGIQMNINNFRVNAISPMGTNAWQKLTYTFTATTIVYNLTLLNISDANKDLTVFISTVTIKNNTNSSIINGDFESNYPTLSSNSILGWNQINNAAYYCQVPNGYYGINTSYNGSYVCVLPFGIGDINQLLNMTIGTYYLILFYININSSGLGSRLLVTMDTFKYFDNINNIIDNWVQNYFIFKATNTKHTISFSNISNTVGSYIFLDNITINKIC
jgi:hypothetical protein